MLLLVHAMLACLPAAAWCEQSNGLAV